MTLNIKYMTRAEHEILHESYFLEKFNQFKKVIDNPENGFFHYEPTTSELEKLKTLHQKFIAKKTFIHVGIGGSVLGPQMLIQSLQKDFEKNFIFIDNIDSEEINLKLNSIKNVEDCLFYIVSKSGETAETIATFTLLRSWLKFKGIEEGDFSKYFVFCTDPERGALRKYANENKYECLDIPSNIGGRFSVQTPVGLFPALFAGIDIELFFEGIKETRELLLNQNFFENILLQTANRLYSLNLKWNVTQTVLMPYSSRLKLLPQWFVQLWGESLGKTKKNGTPSGLTPIPAYGASDQHSQVQLFMQGPLDKCIFMLKVEERSVNFSLDSNLEFESAKKLNGKTLNQLMEAEFIGTVKALNEAKRDVIELSIQEVNEKNLASLILFFESLTALMGIYLEIDPFNQPGVEKGKIYAFQYLNSL